MIRFFENWPTREALRSISAADHLTVVVGAGASMEAGLPSWRQLVESLLDDAVTERGWARDGPAIKDYASRNGLLTAAEVASALLGESDLGDKVKERLYQGADAASLTPGPLANAVAALQDAFGPRMSIGTFNYDDLIETALRARPTTARWWDQVRSYIQGREPGSNTAAVTHLHGLRGREDKGHVVLTESDYQIMQTSTSCWQEDWFIARLRASTCLFVGISMSDPNLLRYLHRAPRVGRPHYALLLRDNDDAARSKDDRTALRPSATSRERCEETERLRWAKLGVTVLFVDNYADVAQFIWELVLRIENDDRYQSLPRRLRSWWSAEEARGCLFAATERGYKLLQDDLHDALRDILADVRDELATELRRIRRETLQVTLWAIAPPEAGEQQERVRTLAHTDRVMTDPQTRETIPLSSLSNWTGVRCLCLGRPIHDPQDNYASRWKYVVGVPIFRETPRTPLGALTIASMAPARHTALAALSARAIGSLDRLAQVAAAPWLTMSS